MILQIGDLMATVAGEGRDAGLQEPKMSTGSLRTSSQNPEPLDQVEEDAALPWSLLLHGIPKDSFPVDGGVIDVAWGWISA